MDSNNAYARGIHQVCNSPISETDAVIVCEKCGAMHHKSCWEFNHGCGNHSCGMPAGSSTQPAQNI